VSAEGETRLLGHAELELSPVVANNAMNRTRRLTGRDGYSRVLGIDIPALLAKRDRPVRWLDLCCGSGRALVDAAELLGERVEITGVDLVGYFTAHAPKSVSLRTASITDWEPAESFDLITCVHGLHYLGDKLGTLTRAASWLTDGGQFVANFDASSIRLGDGEPAGRQLTAALRRAGFTYDGRARRIRTEARDARPELPFRYLGADERAGPNYTGQPAVHSYYELSPNPGSS
jgi:SAM-dependent methyltransferase